MVTIPTDFFRSIPAGATIEPDLEGLLAVPRSLGYMVEYRRAERPVALTAS